MAAQAAPAQLGQPIELVGTAAGDGTQESEEEASFDIIKVTDHPSSVGLHDRTMILISDALRLQLSSIAIAGRPACCVVPCLAGPLSQPGQPSLSSPVAGSCGDLCGPSWRQGIEGVVNIESMTTPEI